MVPQVHLDGAWLLDGELHTPTGVDAAIVALDGTAAPVWAKRIALGADVRAGSFFRNGDRFFLAGTRMSVTDTVLFILALDMDWQVLWGRTFDPGDPVMRLNVRSDGADGVLLSAQLGVWHNSHGVVLRFDGNGVNDFALNTPEGASAVGRPGRQVVIMHRWISKLDADGTLLWTSTFASGDGPADAIAWGDDGFITLSRYTGSSSTGNVLRWFNAADTVVRQMAITTNNGWYTIEELAEEANGELRLGGTGGGQQEHRSRAYDLGPDGLPEAYMIMDTPDTMLLRSTRSARLPDGRMLHVTGYAEDVPTMVLFPPEEAPLCVVSGGPLPSFNVFDVPDPWYGPMEFTPTAFTPALSDLTAIVSDLDVSKEVVCIGSVGMMETKATTGAYLFPMPTNGTVQVGPAHRLAAGDPVVVRSVTGAVVLAERYGNGIELGTLPPGPYTVHLPDGMCLKALVVP